MARKHIRFIINPISGVGRQRVIESLVEKHLDSDLYEAEMVYTEGPRHATQLAAEAAEADTNIVVAVGGDGSVNEVGQGLVRMRTAMAVIPTGSGNGLARHLGIPRDLRKAVERLNQPSIREIDTVELNGTTFLGVAGVGFDALIAKAFDAYGQRGFLSYVRLVLREMNSYKPGNYRLWVDGKQVDTEAFVISVANSSQYGNGAQIAPMASISDGVLDISIVKPFPAVMRPEMVVRLFRGTLHRTKHVEYLNGTRVVIEQPEAFAHMDGEPINSGKRLEFAINPLSLKVVI